MTFFRGESWIKVLGPVFYYDLIRQARRRRFIVLRIGYLILLAVLLFHTCARNTNRYLAKGLGESAFPEHSERPKKPSLREPGYFEIDAREASHIAESYFDLFMLTQFLTLTLLTPVYVAGAITEEKERKTLDFILATDLRSWEIVLSKLGSRLANLFLLLLTGLPILSFLQFLGGVDPNLVFAGFAITALSVIGMASVSIFWSVICARSLAAICLTYLFAILVCVDGAVSLAEVRAAGADGTLATVLPGLVRRCLIFYGIGTVACSALAAYHVRRFAKVEPDNPLANAGPLWHRLPNPAIGTDPVFWKEIHCAGDYRWTWVLTTFCLLILAAACNANGNWNEWVRFSGSVLACLIVLTITIRASLSITRERERQTLESLLTLPLDTGSILHAKWLGSIHGMKVNIVLLALVWGLGVLTQGLDLVIAPLLMATFLVYAAFGAALGLFFSVTCRTSQRALLLSVLALFAVSAGIPFFFSWIALGAPGDPMNECRIMFAPPVALWNLGKEPDFLYRSVDSVYFRQETAAFMVAGWLIWAVAAFALFRFANVRFCSLTRRETLLGDFGHRKHPRHRQSLPLEAARPP